MKTQIIISEQQITQAGQIKLFQIPLPKTTTKVVAIATDIRIAGKTRPTVIGFAKPEVISGTTRESIEPVLAASEGTKGDLIWDLRSNPLAGRLIVQSMEKANIFYYDQVWAVRFDDGFSTLYAGDNVSAFSVFYKPKPKAVDVPSETTILNCLYKDALGVTAGSSGVLVPKDGDIRVINTGYTLKVLVWIECEEN